MGRLELVPAALARDRASGLRWRRDEKSKVMFWIALPTAICTEPVACAWLASAALVAVTVQLPTAVPVTVLPNSVQLPAPAVSASVSAPLPLPPVTVTVLESPLGMLAGEAPTARATSLS